MSSSVANLIEAAESHLGEIALGPDRSAATVAAALLTPAGNVYTGVCVHLACGIGFCAEHAAVAEMLKHRERRVAAIAALSDRGLLPPCGRCRELLMQVHPENAGAAVWLSPGESLPLRELLPRHWLARG